MLNRICGYDIEDTDVRTHTPLLGAGGLYRFGRGFGCGPLPCNTNTHLSLWIVWKEEGLKIRELRVVKCFSWSPKNKADVENNTSGLLSAVAAFRFTIDLLALFSGGFGGVSLQQCSAMQCKMMNRWNIVLLFNEVQNCSLILFLGESWWEHLLGSSWRHHRPTLT